MYVVCHAISVATSNVSAEAALYFGAETSVMPCVAEDSVPIPRIDTAATATSSTTTSAKLAYSFLPTDRFLRKVMGCSLAVQSVTRCAAVIVGARGRVRAAPETDPFGSVGGIRARPRGRGLAAPVGSLRRSSRKELQ